MASIARHGEFVACISGPKIALFKIGHTSRAEYRCQKVAQEKTTTGSTDEGTDRILAATFSSCGKYFAAVDDHKQVTLWETGDGAWTNKSVRFLARRCTALTFTKSEDAIVVADKSGDAYSFSTSKLEESGQLLLGHVSMLLDVVVCGDDRFILTADRDEKIRVSRYPNAYNVESYCLGHREFVSRLCYLEEEELVVSGSGDGTLRIWNYREGKELFCTDCSQPLGIQLQASDEAQEEVTSDKQTLEKQGESSNGEEMQSEEEESDEEKRTASNRGPEPQNEVMDESEAMTAQNEAASESEARTDQNEATDESEAVTAQNEATDESEAVTAQSEAGTPRADVKCLVYCKKRKLLITSFDGVPVLLAYRLIVDGAGKPKLELVQKLTTRRPPWCVTVDDEGQLWVLQPEEGHMVEIYITQEDNTDVCFERLEDVVRRRDTDISKHDQSDRYQTLLTTQATINSDWAFYNDSLGVESFFNLLHKPRDYKNLEVYQERKKQRLEKAQAGGKKRKKRSAKKARTSSGKGENQCPPATKILKTAAETDG